MSPTASTAPNSPDRSIDQLPAALIASGLAGTDDVKGCEPNEVEQIQRSAPFPLPDDYLYFLKTMGHKAGQLFRGSAWFLPKMMESPQVAEGIAEEPDETLSLEDRFFFGHHQGYIVYFFERSSPAIYCYQEGHPEDPAHKVSDSLTEWAWHFFDMLLEQRLVSRERFESRQRKREAMGLPREEYHEL